MRAVLLAAGLGNRLQHHTADTPKPLVTIGGRPLVSYTLHALQQAGVTHLTAVTGHRAPIVRAALKTLSPIPLTFRHNPHYQDGQSLSLAAARDTCNNQNFLLVMSDHLLAPALLTTLARTNPRDGVAVALDTTPRDPHYTAEATRVTLQNNHITHIGKNLPHFHALDAGAFHCSPAIWEALDQSPPDTTLSTILQALAKQNRLYPAHITGHFWYDVDTPEDHHAAETLLRTQPQTR